MKRFLVCVTGFKVGIYRLSEDFPILETTRDTGTILFFSIHTNDSKEEIQTKLESVRIVDPFTQNGIESLSINLSFLQGARVDGNDLYLVRNVFFKSGAPEGFNIHIIDE